MAKLNLYLTKEQSVRNDAGNTGTGKDRHSPVGLYGGNIYRCLLKPDVPNWTELGIYQVISATLWRKSTSEIHVAIGGSPQVRYQALTAAFSEGGGSADGPNGVGALWSTSAPTVYPGPTASGTTYGSGTQSTADAHWTGTDITGYFESIAPATVLKSDGVTPCGGNTNYGLREFSGDPTSAAKTIEFSSRRADSSAVGYVELVYSTNHPPSAPTVVYLAPKSADDDPAVGSSPALIGSADGKTVSVRWTQNDADIGDYTAARQHQFYADGATDGTPGTALKDVTITSTGSPTSGTDTIAGLSARTLLRHRMRTKDNNGAWGAWTLLANGEIQTAYRSSAPANPYFQVTTTTSPLIAGSINSADAGDTVTGYEVVVSQSGVAGGTVNLWAAGSGGGNIFGNPTRAQLNYAGVQLNPGDSFQYRHRIYGRDGAVGDWSSWISVTMLSVTGPTAMSPVDRNTKILSPVAALTIADAAVFDRYQFRIYRAGALIYDSGVVTVGSTTTVSPAIPAGIANFGDALTWDAAIRHTGNSALDPASPAYLIQIDTLPSTALTASS